MGRNPKLCRKLPRFNAISPVASAFRTHCVRPRGATNIRFPSTSIKFTGVEKIRPDFRPRTCNK